MLFYKLNYFYYYCSFFSFLHELIIVLWKME